MICNAVTDGIAIREHGLSKKRSGTRTKTHYNFNKGLKPE